MKFRKITNQSKGFTLIELVITIALLGITLGVTNDILISLVRSYSKIQVKDEIEQQANFISLKLEKELRSGSRVSTPGSDGRTLSFLSKNNTQITYNVASSGVIMRTVGAGSPQPMTFSGGIGGVVVTCPPSPGTCFNLSGMDPQIVQIDMIFSQGDTDAKASFAGQVHIESTIVVRNSY